MKKTSFIFPMIILGLMLIFAFFPNFITSYSANSQNSDSILIQPNSSHFLGTDSLGRDMLARLLSATKISLTISFFASCLALLIGTLWGTLASFSNKFFSECLMRIVDILYSVPDLLFYILIGLFLGRDIYGLIFTLCSLSWLSIARISWNEIQKYKNQDFVIAAQALGASRFQIIIKHILPQIKGPLLIATLFKIPFLIALESTLSFIGLGLVPPYASFGTLAKEGFDAYLFYPHLILFPFLFIFITVFCFYLIGKYLNTKN